MLTLSILGVPKIEHPSGPVALPRRQPLALLAALALERAALSRERLAFLLWDESPQAQANQRLRRVLYCLRQGLATVGADDCLIVSPTTIALDETRCRVDSWAFEQLAERAVGSRGGAAVTAGEQALDLYQGPLLEGFSVTGAPEFEQWLLRERERLESLHLQAHTALVDGYLALGQTARAIRCAERLLAADPLREETHVTLMRLYAATGQRATALTQFKTCEERLAEELGVAPLPASRALYDTIQRGETPAVEGVPALDWRLRPSLAVPLVGRRAEQEQLRRALLSSLGGQPTVACISGPPGIGKTRLLQEVVEPLPAPTWLGSGQASYRTIPYATAVSALRAALAHLPVRARLTGDGSLLDLPDVWLVEASRLLPDLRAHCREPHAPPLLPPSQARACLFEALTRLTVALARAVGGAILVVDDLDQADPSTLAWLSNLVRYLQQHRAPLGLAVAYRQATAGAGLAHWLDDLARRGVRQDIPLAALSLRNIADLLTDPQLPPPLLPALATSLYRHVGGNPFFVLETLAALLKEPLTGSPLPPHPLPLPDTVREAILISLRPLDRVTRQVLDGCAVLGPTFRFERLCEVSGRSEEETAVALGVLVAQQLLVRDGRRYRFAQAPVARVILRAMGEEWRTLLQRRAGRPPLAPAPAEPPPRPHVLWPHKVAVAV